MPPQREKQLPLIVGHPALVLILTGSGAVLEAFAALKPARVA